MPLPAMAKLCTVLSTITFPEPSLFMDSRAPPVCRSITVLFTTEKFCTPVSINCGCAPIVL